LSNHSILGVKLPIVSSNTTLLNSTNQPVVGASLDTTNGAVVGLIVGFAIAIVIIAIIIPIIIYLCTKHYAKAG
jgi:uncharacterized membrane protein (Fun14 family)